MDTSLVEEDGLKRTLRLIIVAEDILPLYQKELQQIQPNVSRKGFRPGKVPLKLVEDMHGKGVFKEIFENFLQMAVSNALQKCDGDIASMQHVQIEEGSLDDLIKKNGRCVFVVHFELMPSIDLDQFFASEGFASEKIVKPVVLFDEAAQEKIWKDYLKDLRLRTFIPHPADCVATAKDWVRAQLQVLDQKGQAINSQEEDILSLPVDLNQDKADSLLFDNKELRRQMIEQLQGRLEGVKVGDSFAIVLKPEKENIEEGKELLVKVTIKTIGLAGEDESFTDDSFLQAHLTPDSGVTVDDARAFAIKERENKAKNLEESYVKRQIFDIIEKEAAHIELPEVVLEEEKKYTRSLFSNLASDDIDENREESAEAQELEDLFETNTIPDLDDEDHHVHDETCTHEHEDEGEKEEDIEASQRRLGQMIEKLSQRRMRASLIFNALAQKHKFQPSQEQIADSVWELSRGDVDVAKDLILRAKDDANVSEYIHRPLVEIWAINYILDNGLVKVQEESMTFEELSKKFYSAAFDFLSLWKKDEMIKKDELAASEEAENSPPTLDSEASENSSQ